jgi:ankyrin repeat protein
MLDILLTGPMDLINEETGVSILGDALRTGSLHGSGVGRILRHGERCKESGISTLKVLCKYGANSHFDEVPGYPGCNVLSIACSLISPEAVEFLLADLNCSKYVNIFTPPPGIANKAFVEGSVMYGLDGWRTHLLYSAMINRRPRVFQLLLDYGADPNLKIQSDQRRQLTILHMCVIDSQDTTFVKVAFLLHLLSFN